MFERRDFLRLGLGGSVYILMRLAGKEGGERSAGYLAGRVHRSYPLEFRLDSGYVPDLSDESARLLSRAVVDFLDREHPDGLTMTFWDLNPRQMPYLRRHVELIVEHLFRGVRDNLDLRPVDPIVVLSLLYNESRYHPKVVSPAGAVGMAQFMPDTALDFGLGPIARQDLWERFRRIRSERAGERAKTVRSFRRRHGVRSFSADAVIDRAIETRSVDLLEEYRRIVDAPDPAADALRDYVAALEEVFARYQFFWDGRAPLGRIDGRVSYEAVVQAVRYVARSLREHQGMASTAAASYNAGHEAVRVRNRDSILHRFGDIPSYGETIRYVQRFMAVYSAIKYRLWALER